MRISAIVPVLYEEPQLAETIRRLDALRDRLDLQILVVVDIPDSDREAAVRSSIDPVVAIGGAEVLYRVGERGFGSALRFAFAHAAGDAMVPIMADVSEDPMDVVRMSEALDGGLDVAAGSRYMRGGGIVGNTPKQRISRVYSVLVRLASGIPIHDVSNAFKLYRRTVVEQVPTLAESFDISVELTLKAHQAGFRIGEIPTVWTNRVAGRSNFTFWRELRNYGRWLVLAARARLRCS